MPGSPVGKRSSKHQQTRRGTASPAKPTLQRLGRYLETDLMPQAEGVNNRSFRRVKADRETLAGQQMFGAAQIEGRAVEGVPPDRRKPGHQRSMTPGKCDIRFPRDLVRQVVQRKRAQQAEVAAAAMGNLQQDRTASDGTRSRSCSSRSGQVACNTQVRSARARRALAMCDNSSAGLPATATVFGKIRRRLIHVMEGNKASLRIGIPTSGRIADSTSIPVNNSTVTLDPE